MKAGFRARRLGLLLLSYAIGLLAFGQMILRVNGSFPARYAIALGVDGLLLLVFDLVLAWRQPYATQAIVPTTALLSLLGITEITRIDYERISNGYPSDSGMRQLQWLGLAVVLSTLVVAFLRDYRVLRRFSYLSMTIGLILLLSPEIPGLGRNINGARIWIHFGPFSLQPAEFAKLFLAVFFAAYLFAHADQLAVGGKKVLGVRWPRLRDLGPIAIVWVVSLIILVLQHDLGTSLMFFAMFVGMLFVATRRKSWLVIGAVAFAGGVVAAAKLFSNFANRVNIWLHPFDQALYTKQYGGTYQVVQGLFGLASGGLFGTGLGQGHPAITPFANSDFIYTSLGEELGLAGLFAILVLYVLIISSGFTTAVHVEDGFGKLLSSGLAFSMAFQIFTVIGGITLVIPLTGLTLPYLAAGGSSLVANWLLLSLILVVSNWANSPKDDTPLDRDPELARRAAAMLAAEEEREKAAEARRESKQKTKDGKQKKEQEEQEGETDEPAEDTLSAAPTLPGDASTPATPDAPAGEAAEAREAGEETVAVGDPSAAEETQVAAPPVPDAPDSPVPDVPPVPAAPASAPAPARNPAHDPEEAQR